VDVVHPEATELQQRAQYLPFFSIPILGSQLHFLRHSPGRYLRALWDVLTGTFGSLKFFSGAIGIFPKSVHAARLMESAGVRHVHCAWATHPAVSGFVIHRLTGIPFSFTAHGSDLHVDRTMLPEKLAEAAFAVTISGFNRNVIGEECGEAQVDKVEIIHVGVDTDFFRPREGERPPGPFRILCVGRLDEGKGQTYLIEAGRRLAAEGVDFVMEVVGEGDRRARLERQIQEGGLGDRVVLDGPHPRAEIAERMRAVDVIVAPSVPTGEGKKEGIPVVLMEAMSCGLPVVASDLAGIAELVEDERTGLLVPSADAGALAAALRRLADDPAWRSDLGRAGREKVVREFDVYLNAAALGDRIMAAVRSRRGGER
jgi:glycosyltransferase involved in cell wall biosynthesis